MKTNPLIVLLSDQLCRWCCHIEALIWAGYRVCAFSNVDLALGFIAKNSADISMVIFSLILPPSKAYSSRPADNSLRTGIFFYQDVQRLCPQAAIIILTDSGEQNGSVLNCFSETSVPRLVNILNCPPPQLVKIIQQILEAERRWMAMDDDRVVGDYIDLLNRKGLSAAQQYAFSLSKTQFERVKEDLEASINIWCASQKKRKKKRGRKEV